MDFKNLTTFMHVAEQNSFTKAGAKLGYSQSTISFQIKQLEEEMGFPLFERVNHTIMLTEKGREVLDYAHRIAQMTAELKASTSDDENLRGTIRLDMAASLCNPLLEEHFYTFRQKYPGISLKVMVDGTGEMFRRLNQNEADAILTLDSHIYNTEYVIVKEEKVDTHFIVPADSPLVEQSEISKEDLLSRDFILTEKGMSYRHLLDEQLALYSIQLEPVLEVGDPDLICKLVAQKAGMSFLPDFVSEPYVKAGLIRRLENVPEIQLDLWKQLIHHRDKWISPQLAIVLQYCCDTEFAG